MVVRMLDYGHWDEYYPLYDVYLWTIPIERRSSVLLLLILLRDPLGLALGWLVVFLFFFNIPYRAMVTIDEPCVRFGRWVEQRMLAAAD
ncbi:uncharacterized protein N7500_001013 [Penicillium coprophilum]|uniref:uncharacterized protein n=1 Tax=Penicillium coprophilum TaxID=36646 RepID=UPI00239A73D5|nr:uncharacterized protein N7500_001013 [Penicillium coprophilum]KAJ5178314.1 hypothetical protein N7500_001013 [Penicillium coprophilum]